MAAYRLQDVGLSAGRTTKRTWEYEVSGNYFDMLGVQPALGRFFHGSDEHGPNSAPYIVLSDAFWRSRFHADPRVVGQSSISTNIPSRLLGLHHRTFMATSCSCGPTSGCRW